MENNLSESLAIYKEQLSQGDIQRAYVALTKYVAELKAKFPDIYRTGGISFGYLDITYFPFTNEWLRENQLRFGIVLNHPAMQIELWLMGRNASVQAEYWEILKDSKWNQDIEVMPIYSVLEVCLESNIDFDNKEKMTEVILNKTVALAQEIEGYLKSIKE